MLVLIRFGGDHVHREHMDLSKYLRNRLGVYLVVETRLPGLEFGLLRGFGEHLKQKQNRYISEEQQQLDLHIQLSHGSLQMGERYLSFSK